MLELFTLIVLILIILIVLYNKVSIDDYIRVTENFDSYYLSGCPATYKTFYNSDGDIVCCDGEVVANRCLSDKQCTLSGKGTPDMPNCVNSILDEYKEKSKTQCTPSMSSYFEDRAKNVKGCTQGSLNNTLTGPRDVKQPTCIIYSGILDNQRNKNSCYNQKLLDKAQCFGNNCSKEVVQPIPFLPVLIAIGFTDNMGMHRVAYTRESLEVFLDATNPNWRSQGTDLSKNINVAEVAKAFYVDRTMDKNEIQF
jgi:hypothetical protein